MADLSADLPADPVADSLADPQTDLQADLLPLDLMAAHSNVDVQFRPVCVI